MLGVLLQSLPGRLTVVRPVAIRPTAALRPGHQLGFTLIELMVALAILAILAAISIPFYNDYSRRAYRAEAQADLLSCAQGLERLAARNFSYENAADGDGDGIGDADTGTLASEVCTPRAVAEGRYTFTVTGAAGTYLLTATPAGAVMAGDGLMTLNEAGRRGWDRSDPSDGDTTDAGENTWEE